jgi:hypothetical protein
MKPVSAYSIIEVQQIGEAALAWASSGCKGAVLAAMSRAIYLNPGGVELYWVTTADSPMHRRCLQVMGPLPTLAPGSMVEITRAGLQTTSGLSLDCHRARVWKEPQLPARLVIPPQELARSALRFFGRMLAQHPPAGLGQLMGAVLAGYQQIPFSGFDLGNRTLSSTWEIVQRIISTLADRDFHSIPVVAEPLVGLGEGLTPSGDDLLGGLLFCLQVLRETYPQSLYLPGNYSSFIEQCRPRTNLISFALLKDHASGHALEPLHQIASLLISGQPLERISPFADDLLKVGHSTGWDLLTGFVVGMAVVFMDYPSYQTARKEKNGYQTEDRKSQ